MAGNAIIGALRVVLGADTAALEKGLKGAQTSLTNFAHSANVAGAAIGVALAGAATALGLAIKHSINEADKLGKMAQSIGIPVEELSKLKHAADLSDVSLEALSKSVGILSKNMVTAAAGAGEMDIKGSKAAKAFKTLKIDVEEAGGGLKSSTQIMTEIAGKFGGMEDGAAKTAIALALFGKSGAAMIPMLNAGADGLRNMMDEAGALGIVIDGKTSAAAERFNDNLKRLGKIKDGIILQVTARMLPAFESLSKTMLDTAKNSDQLGMFAEILTTIMKSAVTVGLTLAHVVSRLGAEFGAFINLINTLRTQDIFGDWSASKKALENFNAVGAESDRQFAALKETLKKFWTDTENAAAAADPVFRKMTAPLIEGTKAAKNALESYLASQAKHLASQQAEAQTFGLAAGAKERLKIQLEALAIAQANSGINWEKYKLQVDAAALASGNMAMQLAGLRLTEENLLPWERYNQILARNAELLAANPALAETVARANRKAADETGMSWKMASEGIAGAFTELASAVGDSNSDIAKAAKIFAAAVAFINILVAQSYALAGPFPQNLVAFALVAAKGAVLMAAIKGAMVPKFAKGADFIVGGSAGIDNNRITMDVSRGERVRVDPVDQVQNASVGGNRTVSIRGISERDYYRGGDVMRTIAEALTDYVRDGGKVEFART